MKLSKYYWQDYQIIILQYLKTNLTSTIPIIQISIHNVLFSDFIVLLVKLLHKTWCNGFKVWCRHHRKAFHVHQTIKYRSPRAHLPFKYSYSTKIDSKSMMYYRLTKTQFRLTNHSSNIPMSNGTVLILQIIAPTYQFQMELYLTFKISNIYITTSVNIDLDSVATLSLSPT